MAKKLSEAQVRWLKRLRDGDWSFNPCTFSGKSVRSLERRGLATVSGQFVNRARITEAGLAALAAFEEAGQ